MPSSEFAHVSIKGKTKQTKTKEKKTACNLREAVLMRHPDTPYQRREEHWASFPHSMCPGGWLSGVSHRLTCRAGLQPRIRPNISLRRCSCHLELYLSHARAHYRRDPRPCHGWCWSFCGGFFEWLVSLHPNRGPSFRQLGTEHFLLAPFQTAFWRILHRHLHHHQLYQRQQLNQLMKELVRYGGCSGDVQYSC